MSETREVRIKRLHMRSIRRGIKEMDLILTDYATRHLPNLSDDELDVYDSLLSESDHDIYGWITKQWPVPERYQPIMSVIMADAEGLTKPAIRL
ncbi:antitoxin CptB [Cognatiyoonia koreensis]|uniref:FAD assembly factor SdhE n=1 Tax=Cognatiyoonia koreensis TaxID=364200 RepID=A0A1I0Q8G9_9RHOB|nr:succinate dehydrogenase assembly factor 2 [Cognatiyoonia koreensis]SEW23286.1 antitoxin CptB [Cognatiyoonia koreensis]